MSHEERELHPNGWFDQNGLLSHFDGHPKRPTKPITERKIEQFIHDTVYDAGECSAVLGWLDIAHLRWLEEKDGF